VSYILDALRRAEAERDRGQVPGLGAQPTLAPAAPATAARPGIARSLAWAAAVLGLAILLAWALWLRAAGPAGQASPGAPAVPPMAGDGAASRPPADAAAAAPAPAPTNLLAAAPTGVPPAAPAPAPLPVVVSAPPLPPPPPAPSPAPRAAPPAQAAAGRAAESRIVPLAELSAEQRRDWPALPIGGAVYSDHAPSRFVIVGGQILHEGGTAAPGLTVERIGPRSVVFRWRELRVEVPL